MILLLFIKLLFLMLSETFLITNMELILRAKMCKICYSKLTTFNISRNKMFNIYDNYIYINEPKTKSVCYIFYNNKKIDICFKGTSSLNDICFNIDIYPTLFIDNRIRLHNGFLKKYLAMKESIIDNINKITKTETINEISFNGYSAGGAIANIASLDMSNIYKNYTINCYTFGSPRVGNKHFINAYNKCINKSVRVVNRNDIISMVPPPILYIHNHKPIILENNDKLFSLNLYKYFKRKHSIITYIKNLYQLNI